MRVLLVEDNKDTIATLAAVLRYEQYDVMTAPDGHVALEMAKLQPPDVVLLDIGLPGMDGYELAQALRKQDPERTLYIAAVTGYGKAEDKERAVFRIALEEGLSRSCSALRGFLGSNRNRLQRCAGRVELTSPPFPRSVTFSSGKRLRCAV